MKANEATFFKSKFVHNGCRPLLSLGIQDIPADEDYPAFTAVVAVTIFGEYYYFSPDEDVKEIDADMVEEANRIKKDEYLFN